MMKRMGNSFNSLASTNINQTQITSINQKCNESASSAISNINITAVDSHIGDITLSSTLSVGDMTCVLDAVSSATASATVTDNATDTIGSLPFQQTINTQDFTQLEQIQSFQQSIIDQSCTEVTKSTIDNVTLTFIDSSTGNIKIATSSQIDSLSCNLSASSYQSAAAAVSNTATGKITSNCCGFDLGMLAPVVLGLVGLVVVSKMLGKKGGADGAGGSAPADPNASLISALNASTQSFQPSKPPPSSMGGTRTTVSSTQRGSIAVQV